MHLARALNFNMRDSGFTLIEFLLYIAIIAVILVLITGFLWDIILGSLKENSWEEVRQNANFSLTKINQEIKRAVGINSPVPGSSSNVLSLAVTSSLSDPTIIDAVDGKLRITKGSSIPEELTSDLVRVVVLQFTNLSYPQTPGTVRIEMTIEHINPDNRNEYSASMDLKSTVSLFPGGAAL